MQVPGGFTRRSGHIAEYFPEGTLNPSWSDLMSSLTALSAFGLKSAIVIFGGRTKTAGQTYSLNDTWCLSMQPRLRWVEQKFTTDESLVSPYSSTQPSVPAAALLPLPRRYA